jgi:hypothetical protein
VDPERHPTHPGRAGRRRVSGLPAGYRLVPGRGDLRVCRSVGLGCFLRPCRRAKGSRRTTHRGSQHNHGTVGAVTGRSQAHTTRWLVPHRMRHSQQRLLFGVQAVVRDASSPSASSRLGGWTGHISTGSCWAGDWHAVRPVAHRRLAVAAGACSSLNAACRATTSTVLHALAQRGRPRQKAPSPPAPPPPPTPH